MTFEQTVQFHGHACPGLAFGYRVACLALEELGLRARDEELVAVVENNSCAVDAIQAVCGCTFGKGNLLYRDYGKQAYTFIRRPSGKAVRIAVKWIPEAEDPESKQAWQLYMEGDRSEQIVTAVQTAKQKKMAAILEADSRQLFAVQHLTAELPEPARIYRSVTCGRCGEKVMEPRAVEQQGEYICIPCREG